MKKANSHYSGVRLNETYRSLESSNDDLLVALENMSDGFCTMDQNWTFTFLNRRVAEMIGDRDREYYLGKTLWECFPEVVATRFCAEYHRAAKEKVHGVVEDYYPPLKTWFEVNVYPNPAGLSFYMKDVTKRRQQEKELKISNERFHLVMEANDEAIWDWNVETGLVEWGEGFTMLFGYEKDLLHRKVDLGIECIHGQDRERVTAKLNRLIASDGSRWSESFRFRRADGSYAYVVDKGYVIRDDAGRAVRLVGAIRDITQQKKQEKRLEFMAKASSEVIWECELDADQVEINAEKFRQLFGYEIAGNYLPRDFWLNRIHPDDLRTIRENRDYAIQYDLDFFLNEYRFKKANNQWAHVKERTFVIRDPYGSAVSLMGAIEDVTRQRHFEKALMKSEEGYRLLFDNAPIPTLIHDISTLKILSANSAAVEQYGYSHQELMRMTILDLHREKDHRRVLRSIEDLDTKKRVDFDAIFHVKKGGRKILVEVSVSRIKYKETDAAVATFNDVTQRVKLQRKLLRQKVNQQQQVTHAVIRAQEAERSAIGRELHDNVQQLLAAASLYVGNIRHVPGKSDLFADKASEILKTTIDEVRRLSHALVSPQVNGTNLKESLQNLVSTYTDLKDIEVDMAFDLYQRNIDPALELTIYRIVQECINNTMKYAAATVVTISVYAKTDTVELFYSDDGKGFEPASIRKGIGLKNIYKRVEAFNGEISITSAINSGFELAVIFPAKTGT